MQKIALLSVLLFAIPASAKDLSRCGTDAFGNNICLDKDGVLSNSPSKPALKGAGKETGAMPAELKSGAEDKPGDEKKSSKPRCGTDPFGNTVCSQ